VTIIVGHIEAVQRGLTNISSLHLCRFGAACYYTYKTDRLVRQLERANAEIAASKYFLIVSANSPSCPNHTVGELRGNSMLPLIHDGFVVAVDASETDLSKLDGKIVIAWHKDIGLTISRFRRFDHTEVLQPENIEYEAVTLGPKQTWKVVAKVLWWVGKAP